MTQSKKNDQMICNSPIQKERKLNSILFLLYIAFMIIVETPYLSRNLNSIIVLGSMLLFLVFFLLTHRKVSMELIKTFLAVIIYLFIEWAMKLAGISTAGIGYYFATIRFFFIFFAFACIAPELSEKQKKQLLAISIIGMLINMISNVFIYLEVGSASYVVYYMRGGENTNAADTAFSTAVMLLMGAMFLIVLHSQILKQRIIALMVCIFCIIFLFFISQRATTFFLSILMILSMMIVQTSSKKRIILLICIAVAVLWCAVGGINTILYWLLDIMNGQRIAYKIEYLIHFFETGDWKEAGGSLTGRINLILTSVTTFLGSVSSFIIGVGDHRNNNLLVGNHSQIVDTLARYGIIGGISLTAVLNRMKVTIINVSMSDSASILRKQLLILYLFFIIRGLLGNIFIGSIGVQIFVTIPLMISLWESRKRA